MYLTESQKAYIRKKMVLESKILQINKKDYKKFIAQHWKNSNPNEPKYMTTSDGIQIHSYSYRSFLQMNKCKNQLRKINRKILNVQAILKELK